MHLKDNEQILRTIHHHPLPFVLRGMKIMVTSLPFYFLTFLFSSLFESSVQLALYASITLIFGLIVFYDLSLFYLDRLIITNKRVLHIDWINLIRRNEIEVMLDDIQDISTSEHGFLSSLKIFDYGHFKLETSSTKTSIIFPEATDPEGIKHFIYNIHKTHSRLDSSLMKNPSQKQPQEKIEHQVESEKTS